VLVAGIIPLVVNHLPYGALLLGLTAIAIARWDRQTGIPTIRRIPCALWRRRGALLLVASLACCETILILWHSHSNRTLFGFGNNASHWFIRSDCDGIQLVRQWFQSPTVDRGGGGGVVNATVYGWCFFSYTSRQARSINGQGQDVFSSPMSRHHSFAGFDSLTCQLGMPMVYPLPDKPPFKQFIYFDLLIPYWAILLPLLAPSLIVSWRLARKALRHHQGLCPTCGYDLRASPSRCPECGSESRTTVRRGDSPGLRSLYV